MKITYEGVTYEFDFDDITVKQAIKIEKHTGLTLSEWGKALSPEEEGRSASLIALQALGWLILHGGRDVPVDDCDFKIVKLGEAFEKADAEEKAAEKEREAAEAAGPTVPAVPLNGSGGGSIPALSRPSSLTG